MAPRKTAKKPSQTSTAKKANLAPQTPVANDATGHDNEAESHVEIPEDSTSVDNDGHINEFPIESSTNNQNTDNLHYESDESNVHSRAQSVAAITDATTEDIAENQQSTVDA